MLALPLHFYSEGKLVQMLCHPIISGCSPVESFDHTLLAPLVPGAYYATFFGWPIPRMSLNPYTWIANTFPDPSTPLWAVPLRYVMLTLAYGLVAAYALAMVKLCWFIYAHLIAKAQSPVENFQHWVLNLFVTVNKLEGKDVRYATRIAPWPVVSAKDHSHGKCASARKIAESHIRQVALTLGKPTYFVQDSDRDKDGPGCRTHHWPKDLTRPARPYMFDSGSVQVIIDTDYYLDMPSLLATAPATYAIYTIQPSKAGETTEEYTMCFNEAGELVQRVRGGGEFVHKLWNYSSDVLTATASTNGIFDDVMVTYAVERTKIADHRQVVWLIPETITHASFPVCWYVAPRSLQRFDPIVRVAGEKFVRFVAYGDVPHVTLARPMMCSSVEVTTDTDAQMLATAQSMKTDVTPYTFTSRFGVLDKDSAMLCLYYRSAKDHDCSQDERITVAFNYQPGKLDYDQDAKPAVAPYMKNLVSPASVTALGKAAEKRAVSGRITEIAPRETMPISSTMENWMNQFVNHFLSVVPLAPTDEDEVWRRQARPSQRKIVAEGSAVPSTLPTLQTFLKREAYGEPKDPRIITTLDPRTKVAWSTFMYALFQHVQLFPWFAFGKTPADIAARVAELAKRAKRLFCTDLSRCDGRVSDLIRALELKLCLAVFGEEWHDQIKKYSAANKRRNAATTNGVKYFTFDTRLSGSPETAVFNTILTAFLCYIAKREQGMADQQAWGSLGIYGGDDGLDADGKEECYVKAGKLTGQKFTVETFNRGETGVNFLARFYGPEVWSGSPISICDLRRTLEKIHLTVPDARPPAQVLTEKLNGLAFTDHDTPVISELVKLQPGSDSVEREGWWAQYDLSVQYPNEKQDWMTDYFNKIFPEFDHVKFKNWVSKAKGHQCLEPPLCEPIRDPKPGRFVVNGEPNPDAKPALTEQEQAKMEKPVAREKPKPTDQVTSCAGAVLEHKVPWHGKGDYTMQSAHPIGEAKITNRRHWRLGAVEVFHAFAGSSHLIKAVVEGKIIKLTNLTPGTSSSPSLWETPLAGPKHIAVSRTSCRLDGVDMEPTRTPADKGGAKAASGPDGPGSPPTDATRVEQSSTKSNSKETESEIERPDNCEIAQREPSTVEEKESEEVEMKRTTPMIVYERKPGETVLEAIAAARDAAYAAARAEALEAAANPDKCLDLATAVVEPDKTVKAADDENEYLTAVLDPVNNISGIPDAAADLSALRRIVLSSTITIPVGVADASLMFVWIPRCRNTQILVMAARGPDWGFLTWLNFELDPLESYRLFRVTSGLLSLDSGTIATGVTQLGGFEYAVYPIGLPDLFGIDNPSELLQYRRSENGQLPQTPLFKGLRMLVPPDGDPGFNQPDNRYVPTAVLSSAAPPTFVQPVQTDPAYFRVGQYTVARTDEAVRLEITGQDSGWLTTGWSVYNSGDPSIAGMTSIWSSGSTNAQFPPFVYGELLISGVIPVTITAAPTGTAACALVLRLAVRVPRVAPTTFNIEVQNYEYAIETVNLNVSLIAGGAANTIEVPFSFRYRPTGPVKGILLQGAYMNYTGTASSVTGAAYQPFSTIVAGGGVQANRRSMGGQMSITLIDMTTKSGLNSPNMVAILGALSPSQVVSVNACANIEFVPNAVLAPNVKVLAQGSHEDDMRVARLAVAVSPIFRGIYTSEDYAKALLYFAQMGASRETLTAHAWDWKDVWNGVKKAVGFVAPTVNSLASAFNPMLGQITSGITGLIANSRDSSALARDSQALARDRRGKKPKGQDLARYDRIPVSKVVRSADSYGPTIGQPAWFATEEDTPDGEQGGLWRVAVHRGPPPDDLLDKYTRQGVGPYVWAPTLVRNSDDAFASLLLNMCPGDGDLTVRFIADEYAKVSGHSWHAAALMGAAGMKANVVWTGSPFVGPGALPFKFAVARAAKKTLVIMGRSVPSAAGELPGVVVRGVGTDPVPNSVICLGVLAAQTPTIDCNALCVLGRACDETVPNDKLLATALPDTVWTPKMDGGKVHWRVERNYAARKFWAAYLATLIDSEGIAPSGLLRRTQRLIASKDGYTIGDAAQLRSFALKHGLKDE